MPRRPRHHRLKRNLIYTVAKAADAVGMHRQTVTRWITHGGLPADRNRRPWLIRGDECKDWLSRRHDSARTMLKSGEVYCLPCHRPVQPDGGFAEFRRRTERPGMLVGIRPLSDRLIHRAVRERDLRRVAGSLEVTIT
jgi:excisionase family DNA binding protein